MAHQYDTGQKEVKVYPINSISVNNPQSRYWSQDIMVNSTGSSSLNRSYRDVNQPIHVEPAAKLYLSPEALSQLAREK